MAKWTNFRMLLIPGIVIVLLIVGGFMFFKPGPKPQPNPVQLQRALLIEIDPGFHARQVMDIGNTLNFYSDQAEAYVHVGFKGPSPCASGPAQDGTQGVCVIATAATDPFIFEYCTDLKSFPNSCAAGTATGEVRVRKMAGAGEQDNYSVSVAFITLTKTAQINHIVLSGELVKWAERDHHDTPRPIVFSPGGPSAVDSCEPGPGTSKGQCTIRPSVIGKNLDYECEVTGCKDPTLHVRTQNPNPPSPTSGPQPSSTN